MAQEVEVLKDIRLGEGLAVARREIKGFFRERKFGRIDDIDTGNGFLDVWDYNKFSGIQQYTFSTTDDINTVSSSSAADTQLLIVVGLQGDGKLKAQTVTLDGQNKVTLTTPLLRVHRMAVIPPSSTDLAGDVYCYVDGAITAGVPDDANDIRAFIRTTGIAESRNQTQMTQFTVPYDKTGYVTSFGASTLRQATGAMDIVPFFRPLGGVFANQGQLALNSQGTGTVEIYFDPPIPVPGGTDINIKADSSANNSAVSVDYNFYLVNNDLTDPNYDVDGLL